MVETRLYTRRTHGSIPVDVHGDNYKLWLSDTPTTYTDRKSLLAAIYSRTKCPPISWDRYFRQGPYLSKKLDVSTLDIFVDVPVPVMAESLGIELADWYADVRKIFFKHFFKKCLNSGYDPEDVLQEVYRGLLARNLGICPFDATKSSRGHYIFIVCSCVLANYRRREGRRAKNEVVGVKVVSDEGFGNADASETAVESNTTEQDTWEYGIALGSLRKWIQGEIELMADSQKRKAQHVLTILPLMGQGYSLREIANVSGLKTQEVTTAVKLLRQLTRVWAIEEGLTTPQ